MRQFLWCAIAAVGCVGPNVMQCPEGIVCPADNICGVAPSRCISPEQLAACDGIADGEPCVFSGASGQCVGGICERQFCGDSVKAPGEQCDGVDLGGMTCATRGFYKETVGLACNADCTFNYDGCSETCGDSAKNGTELCDGTDVGDATCRAAGFYEDAGLKCSAFCTYDVTDCKGWCGDQMINGGELCDGTAPRQTCYELGLDAGVMDCNNACSFELADCARFGFQLDAAAATVTACGAMHGSSKNDIWSVSTANDTWHFNGTTWTKVATGVFETWTSIWVLGPTDAWMVGDQGAVMHWNGSTWSDIATAPANARAIWASATDDVWIATLTEVYRGDGSNWSAVPGHGLSEIEAIHGSSMNNVWVVGYGGSAARWTGSSWSTYTIAADASLHDVSVFAPDNVWVVGQANPAVPPPLNSLFARWDGANWTVTKLFGGGVFTVTASGPTDIWRAVMMMPTTTMERRGSTSSTRRGACSRPSRGVCLRSIPR